MVLPKIALRNLSRQKKRSFLLGGALAFGMLILVAVNGFTGGLVSSIQKNFASLIAGHIYFAQFEKGEDGRLLNIVKDDAALLAAIKAQGIEYTHTSRRTTLNSTVFYSGQSVGRIITGVDWKEDTQLAQTLIMKAGSAQNMAGTEKIIISTGLAEGLGLLPKKTLSYKDKSALKQELRQAWLDAGKGYNLDQKVEEEAKKIEAGRREEQNLAAPKAIGEVVLVQFRTIYGQINTAEFEVAGIYEAQMDVAAYVDREVLNKLADMPAGSYNLFGLTLKDYSGLDMKTLLLSQILKDKYDLYPMEKIMGKGIDNIIGEIQKEDFQGSKSVLTNLNNEMGMIIGVMMGVQAGSLGLFVVIMIVIMIGLVNTFRIVIYERTKEIGTMRAVGTQRNQIRNLFLLEALFLALGGTIPGALLGYGLAAILRLFEFSAMTEMAFFMDNGRFAFVMDPGTLIFSFFIVVLFTLTAALLPARKAARMEPAHALRAQF